MCFLTEAHANYQSDTLYLIRKFVRFMISPPNDK